MEKYNFIIPEGVNNANYSKPSPIKPVLVPTQNGSIWKVVF